MSIERLAELLTKPKFRTTALKFQGLVRPVLVRRRVPSGLAEESGDEAVLSLDAV
jgi:hypothetical protein